MTYRVIAYNRGSSFEEGVTAKDKAVDRTFSNLAEARLFRLYLEDLKYPTALEVNSALGTQVFGPGEDPEDLVGGV